MKSGRVALLTGAAGGIGTAIAERLAQERYGLLITDLAAQPLERLMRRLRKGGVQVSALAADVRDPETPQRLVVQAMAELGRIDVLAGAAGASRLGQLAEVTPQDWSDLLDLNLSSAFRMSQAVAKQLVAQRKGGAIVHIASIAYRSGGGHPAYGAAKGGLVTLCYGMAQRLGPQGITVNAVAPGVIDTPMVRSGFRGTSFRALERGARMHTPLRRLGTPRDVAEVVAFLASERACFITGAVVPVTGGIELLPPIDALAAQGAR